jgi:hypothetical protein
MNSSSRELATTTGSALERGPVRILCDEIGFPWDRRLEHSSVLVAFVRRLVDEIERLRWMQEQVMKMGGKGPSKGSGEVLLRSRAMLAEPCWDGLVSTAAEVHDACHRLNPEDAVPTDHLIDMLSSCASAIRFGLEDRGGMSSRHAAAAAQHVWAQVYGVSLFDGRTPAWEKDWARQMLTEALISLLPSSAKPALGDKSRDEP